jgi:hypothetical protein
MYIKRLPVLPEDIQATQLGSDKVAVDYEREFSHQEYEKLKLGHLPMAGGDFLAAIYHHNKLSIYFVGSRGISCNYELVLAATSVGAKVVEAWAKSQTIASRLELELGELLHLNRLRPLTANDWKTHAMPPERTEIEINELFSPREFAHLMWGILPLQMEDKWFAYSKKMCLYWHRSWTGICIYEVHFEKFGEEYIATKLYINANPKENPNDFTNASLAIRLMRGHVQFYPCRYETRELPD